VFDNGLASDANTVGCPTAIDATFHVEHIIPRQHGGSDELDNLSLACDRRNLTKGPSLASFDIDTGTIVPLFHPRREAWDRHFVLVAAEIVGLTPSGRATVTLLQMNADHRRQLRAIRIAAGVF
jgi:hypothetical protein